MQPTCSPPAAHRQPTGRRRELRARPLPSGLSSLKTQTWPGAFLINIPALFSIVSMVTAGSMQGAEEAKLIDAQPDRFPAPVAKYVKVAFAEWRSGKSGKPLVETLRGERPLQAASFLSPSQQTCRRVQSRMRSRRATSHSTPPLPLPAKPVCDWMRVPVCDCKRVPVCDSMRVPVCDCKRVPVCDCKRVPVCDCERVPVCDCMRVAMRSGALDQFKKENENKGGGVHGAMLLEIGAVTSPSQNVDSVSSGAKQLTHGPRGQAERLA